ncbi:MAG: transglycosylase SLT domain-containing protein [Gammaproteobacteria bacterium]
MNQIVKRAVSHSLFFILAGSMLLSMDPAAAATLEQQREQFIHAKNALRARKIKTFKKLAKQLKDYPLYPYLLHDYLRTRLWKARDREVIGFLKRYGDLPMANDLRRDWLKYLAKRGRWQSYLENYTPQDDEVLQCNYLNARLNTNNMAYLLEDIRSLWLSGNSLPPQCDAAFKLLYKSELMTDQLVWNRIRLAMENGKTSLSKYLSRRLNKRDRKWVARWIATHHNPSKWTHKPRYKDLPVAREILAHGVIRLAYRDIGKAIKRWNRLQSSFHFLPEETVKVERTLAVTAARNGHKKARLLLDRIDNSQIDREIFHWRLVTALDRRDWQELLKWTSGSPPVDAIHSSWLYWHARALEETGDTGKAEEIFRIVAGERDYYGFLAADHVGLAYRMNHHSLPEDLEEWQNISQKPAIVRARELYHLGMVYSARREWHHAFNNMTSYQMQIAAAIAANWGWHDRAILTLGKARAYDDLVLRFPLPYEKIIKKNVKKRKLDLSWVYALIRAESVFMEDARSPTGALGLMQVMPATGRQTARAIGWKHFHTRYLLHSNKNIPIGATYLRQMYDKFHANMIVATAAYNAGPNNVKTWLPKKGCTEPDIWIEKIPFNETRRYVRRILYYASIYDWRMQRKIIPVQQRMAMVIPAKHELLAEQTCPENLVSQK